MIARHRLEPASHRFIAERSLRVTENDVLRLQVLENHDRLVRRGVAAGVVAAPRYIDVDVGCHVAIEADLVQIHGLHRQAVGFEATFDDERRRQLSCVRGAGRVLQPHADLGRRALDQHPRSARCGTSVPGCSTASALLSQPAVISSTVSGKTHVECRLNHPGKESMLGTDECRGAAVQRHVYRIAKLTKRGDLGQLQRHS